MSSLAITILVLHVLLQCWRKNRLMCEGTVRMKLFKSDREQLGTVLDMDICRVRCAMANIKKAPRIPIENCLQECSRSLKTGSDSGLKDDFGKRSRRSATNGTKSNTKKVVLKPTEKPTGPGVPVGYGKVLILHPEEDISGLKLKTLGPSMTQPTLNEKIMELFFKANNASQSCENASYRKNDKTLTASGQNTRLLLSVNVTFIGGNKTWHATASWKFNLTGRVLRNITGYMVFWNTDSSNGLKCRRLPQNQTMVNISDADGWSYPEVLYLTVQPIPDVEGKDFKLVPYSPKDSGRVRREVTNDQPKINLPPGLAAPVTAGIVSGLLLVVILILSVFIKRRISRGSTGGSTEESDSINLSMLQGSTEVERFLISYFPESEEVVTKVERMCAWLRQKGYDVLMDNMASVEIASLGRDRWIHQQIKKAKKIVIVKTAGYLNLYEQDLEGRDGPVSRHRVEVRFVSDEYYKTLTLSKFICIELEGCKEVQGLDAPPWMERIFLWPSDREKLLLCMSDKNTVQIV